MRRFGYYALSSLGVLATAIAGSVASIQSQSFYRELEKPEWAPPAQVFGSVWSVLYIMIAVSAGMALSAARTERRPLLIIVLFLQFALNGLWTWIFFVWRNGAYALADITALWISIVVLIILFWRISKFASLALVPYLIWVSYAGALNFALMRANPGQL